MELDEINKLINELKKLNLKYINNEKQNFFDVCGFPHYENVVSNILAYFLEKSDFQNLFLKSIFNMLEIDEKDNFVLSVDREVYTGDKKRIDLLIETSKNVVAIENKIYADDEGQPYKSYKEYLNKKFKNKEKRLLVLLSVFQDKSKSDDKNYLDCIRNYNFLLEELKKNLGYYLTSAKTEEIILLKNFINNLENIMGNKANEKYKNNKEIEILMKNSAIITKSFDLLFEYKEYIIDQFGELLKNKFDISDDDNKSWKIAKKTEEWLENNLSLSEFSQYGNIVISLWISPKLYSINLAIPKSSKKDGVKINENSMEEDGKWWYIISKKEYKLEEVGLIDLDQSLKDAEELIENFKNNTNRFFEIE